MFTGIYQHNLDSKGRVIMPTKLRDELGHSFYVSKGINSTCLGVDYLQVYPIDKWENFLNRISEKLPFNEAQNLIRSICAGASLVTPNEQGRFLIPPNLREYAKIEKEVSIIGSGHIVEIWSVDNWEYNESQIDREDILSLMSRV